MRAETLTLIRILLIGVVAYVVIRLASAAARRLERDMSRGEGIDGAERTKRAQTIGRIVQKTISIVIATMAVLMVLRQLDIDITPVLTGAGIAGLAVGFGAQTLVRDILSGFFLIFEDQIRVGDVAVVNGQGGLVEEVNLRTLVLRDEKGAVHIFPNGEVKTLANMSKDFSYYVVTVGVAYDGDVDRVVEAMHAAGKVVGSNADLKPHILEPLEVLGVDAFEPGQLVVKARIKTVPLKQWVVGRELRKQIARMMSERGITMPTQQMTVRLERDRREGVAAKPESRVATS
ncbi:MAG: mechanosensitive ion channel [Acidobacteria bacterium]|nr:mechanosensitive ion channel [Acidobacteriota bacterium]